MKDVRNCLRQIGVSVLLLSSWLLVGCQTNPSGGSSDPQAAATGAVSGVEAGKTTLGGEIFKPGDTLTIIFSDLPTVMPAFDVRVGEDGTFTLVYNQSFKAAGKTRQELQEEIRKCYVPNYYKYLTVTIRPILQFYFVGGQVRLPNRYEYLGKMTVLKAIQSAGGFTDFANKKKVRLNRGNSKPQFINAVKALSDSSLDVEVLPGDSIDVPRRIY